jgi:predicted amidohydrolase YtcJ
MLGDLQRLPWPEHATAAPNDAPEHHGGDRSRHTVDVLVRGRVATGNPAQPLVAAMGVRNERIVALGTVDELEELRGNGTEIVDAGDGVVIPGLIEPHMHLWSTGLFQGWLDCSHQANPSVDDVVARIKDAVARAKSDDWVCGQLFDPSLYPGEPVLTAAILDQLSSVTPIVIANASMHFAYVNSKVFEIAGITSTTPDPPSGKFYRANGQLTGVVGELNGMMAVISRIHSKTPGPRESRRCERR